MIIVTGAAGFIGSGLISRLNQDGFQNIIAVDDFSKIEKAENLEGKTIKEKVERNALFEWLDANHRDVEFSTSARVPTPRSSTRKFLMN
jgi:ADP-L-glycero-D-manno-heptose 6-epimerase